MDDSYEMREAARALDDLSSGIVDQLAKIEPNTRDYIISEFCRIVGVDINIMDIRDINVAECMCYIADKRGDSFGTEIPRN